MAALPCRMSMSLADLGARFTMDSLAAIKTIHIKILLVGCGACLSFVSVAANECGVNQSQGWPQAEMAKFV
jgi:hypothetical protein